MKTVLVTGGLGFIGSHTLKHVSTVPVAQQLQRLAAKDPWLISIAAAANAGRKGFMGLSFCSTWSLEAAGASSSAA